MTAFELGRILYEARIREAWNYAGTHAEDRLAKHPYPRHPADADPRSQNCAEIELAQAQAKALLKVCTVSSKDVGSPSLTEKADPC